MRHNYLEYFKQIHGDILPKLFSDINGRSNVKETKYNKFSLFFNLSARDYHEPDERKRRVIDVSAVFIPEKDILEHSKGLLPFIEQKQTGFNQIYKDVLVNAQDIPTQQQSETQKSVCQMIADIIGGGVHWDKGDGTFYTLRTDGTRIPFANEASGYKKLGYLWLLVSSGQIREGSVLLWDEPENSLNPELVPMLVDILLKLASGGVQIFIGTHDYNLARYFDVRKDKSVPVMYHNLSKAGGRIVCESSPEYIKLPDNLLEKASADLFKAVVADAMEVQDDE
jgi:hypothetical protein